MIFKNLIVKLINLLPLYIMVIGLFLFIGCKEEDDKAIDVSNQNPTNFTVTVSEIFGTVVNLKWDASTDPDGDDISYTVVLEGQEIATALGGNTYSITDLMPRYGYAGKVLADDGRGGIIARNFAFNTTDLVIEWQRILGGTEFDASSVVRETQDGGYIVGGYANSGDGDVIGNYGALDFWVVKLNDAGETQWQRNLGGSLEDILVDIHETKEGDYLLAGNSFSGDHDLQSNYGDTDAWIVKLDNNGNMLWETNLGGTETDRAQSVKQTFDGGVIVAAMTHSVDGNVTANNGHADCWIVKLDGGGSLIWETTIGGSEYDRANDIYQNEDGSFMVFGITYSEDEDVGGNNGGGDYWLVKLDPFGEIIWEMHYGGTKQESPAEMLQTADGGYIISGRSESADGNVSGNNGSFDFWVVKLDASGNVRWDNHYGGSKGEFLGSIYETNDRGYIISGYSYSNDGDVSQNLGDADAWIIKIDEMGRMIWETNLGGTDADFAGSIAQTHDGGLVFAGYTSSNDGNFQENKGSYDYLVMKLK